MKRLGIIGAENSHTAAIARELNVEQTFPDFRVTHVWGETEAFARKAAEEGQIPTIVSSPNDMLGHVDCVMVDHRDGGLHLAAVTPFVNAGVPVFVDKPMSTSREEAVRFLALRKKMGVPVTTMSALPHQACMNTIREQMKAIGALRALHICGPGDPDSVWGGIFFYGIHQIDLIVDLLGTAPQRAMAVRNGKAFTGVVSYPDGVTATVSMPGGVKAFALTAVGTTSGFHAPIVMDASMYRATAGIFTRMFATGVEPFTDQRMLAPIAILEALRTSLETGCAVDIAAV